MFDIKRNIFIFIIFFSYLFISSISFAYEAFDGNYKYREYNEGSSSISTYNDDVEVLFIMDFSSSMNKKMGYTPKAFLAIDAIRDVLRKYGNEAKIGLRIFGVTDKPIVEFVGDSYKFNKENLCSASSLIMPIAKYNSENISSKLSTVTPQGVTPITYALKEAIQNDFSPNAKLKHIILVTDGVENCGGNPCFYIKRIMNLRDDIKIDVIGVTVDQNAYSQLKCISTFGKGKYYSIENVQDFNLKFREAFNSKINLNTTINNIQQTPVNSPKPINFSQSGVKYKNITFQFEN